VCGFLITILKSWAVVNMKLVKVKILKLLTLIGLIIFTLLSKMDNYLELLEFLAPNGGLVI